MSIRHAKSFFYRKFRHAKSEHLSLLPGMLITWPCTLTSYRTSKWCGPWTCCWELVLRFWFSYFMTSSSYHVKMKHILLIIGLLWWPEYHLYQILSSAKFTNDRLFQMFLYLCINKLYVHIITKLLFSSNVPVMHVIFHNSTLFPCSISEKLFFS